MPSSWTDNQFEGVALRKIISKLQRQAERIDGEKISDRNLFKLMKIGYCLKDLATAKANIAKTHDLDQRITRLENAAQLAQTTPPIQQ